MAQYSVQNVAGAMELFGLYERRDIDGFKQDVARAARWGFPHEASQAVLAMFSNSSEINKTVVELANRDNCEEAFAALAERLGTNTDAPITPRLLVECGIMGEEEISRLSLDTKTQKKFMDLYIRDSMTNSAAEIYGQVMVKSTGESISDMLGRFRALRKLFVVSAMAGRTGNFAIFLAPPEKSSSKPSGNRALDMHPTG